MLETILLLLTVGAIALVLVAFWGLHRHISLRCWSGRRTRHMKAETQSLRQSQLFSIAISILVTWPAPESVAEPPFCAGRLDTMPANHGSQAGTRFNRADALLFVGSGRSRST